MNKKNAFTVGVKSPENMGPGIKNNGINVYHVIDILQEGII